MLSILDAYTEVLPPTKTYGRRSLCWIPANPQHPEADGRLGNLSIKLEHARTGWGRNVECDTYAIERDTPLPGDNGGAAFWLQNFTDPEQEQPYRCVLGGLNRLSSCTCTAGKCRVPGEPDVTDGCKHRDALLHLIQEGFLEAGEVVDYASTNEPPASRQTTRTASTESPSRQPLAGEAPPTPRHAEPHASGSGGEVRRGRENMDRLGELPERTFSDGFAAAAGRVPEAFQELNPQLSG